MNKKILGFSLVSSMLVGSASGVVSANWKDKALSLAAVDNKKTSKYLNRKLADPFFPEGLGVTEEMKKAVDEAKEAMEEYIEKYADLLEKSGSTSITIKNKKIVEEELADEERKVDELVKNAEQLFKEADLFYSVIFPWDDVKEKYSFIFREINSKTNAEDIRKKLTFITEDEQSSTYCNDYVKTTVEIRNATYVFTVVYKGKNEGYLKRKIVKPYLSRLVLERKILEEWISKNEYTSFKYPIILYRFGNIKKKIIDSANLYIDACNDTLQEILKLAEEIKNEDEYFKKEGPVYVWTHYGKVEDHDFSDKKKNWFGKERFEKMSKLLKLKGNLDLLKERVNKKYLAERKAFFLPWQETSEYSFLFDLKNNENLDTKVPEEDIEKCFEETISVTPTGEGKVKKGMEKLESLYFYTDQIVGIRERMNQEGIENVSLQYKLYLVMVYQAKKWIEDINKPANIDFYNLVNKDADV